MNQSSFGLTGHVEDQFDELSLVYMQARYYDPSLGRFLSIDAAGFDETNPQSFNRYAYANNNPHRYVDPDGNIIFLAPFVYSAVTFIAKEVAVEVVSNHVPAVQYLGVRKGVTAGVKALGKRIKSRRGDFDQDNAGDLFRVVDDVELADIEKSGAFRTTPGQFEGKQFVDNLDDAKALQKKFSEFFGGNQTIVRGQAPKDVIDNASRIPFADIPNGTAITIPKADLPAIKPRL